MTYANAKKFLTSLPKTDVNFDRAHKALEILVPNEQQSRIVHVMGKYGKNSCHRMLSSILREAGVVVGGYSPSHAAEPREAITIDGKPVSHEDFALIISEIKSTYSDLDDQGLPSAEEVLCLAAVIHFSRSGCDVSILEKGLSKTDAVNLTRSPAVTLISAIIDPAPEELAFTESFRRECTETVTATQSKAIYSLISERCVEIGSRLTLPLYGELEINNINPFKTSFSYRAKEYSIRSFSPCQTINAIAIIEAASALTRSGINITEENIRLGLERAVLPLKCEAISLDPVIIVCDVSDDVMLDTTVAALAQLNDTLNEKITLAVDPECKAYTDRVLRAFNSQDICVCGIDTSLTTAKYRKHVASLIAPLLEKKGRHDALIFLGCTDFIRTVSEFAFDKLHSI